MPKVFASGLTADRTFTFPDANGTILTSVSTAPTLPINLTIGGALNLVTTSTDGLALQNTTPATVGVPVQISPRFRQRGTAWDTAASETVDFFTEVLPGSAATPTGSWRVGFSVNGGAATYPMTLLGIGRLTILGDMFVGATGSYSFSGRSIQLCNADGQLNYTNNSNTAGIGLDFATDALLKFRTRAQTGDASISALNHIASGYYEGTEMTPPSAGAVNTGRLYFDDNGSGKTRLMVLFNTGAAIQLAIQV